MSHQMMDFPRTYLHEELMSFLTNDRASQARVLFLSSPKGTGKTQAVRHIVDKFENVYYEFHGGELRKDQTCMHCLVELHQAISRITALDRTQEDQSAQFKMMDPTLFFEQHLARLLQEPSPRKLVVVVDGPERCQPESVALLWEILCSVEGSSMDVSLRLIVVTSRAAPFVLQDGVTSVNKVCSNQEVDEVVYGLLHDHFVDSSSQPQDQHVSRRIQKLASHCKGNLLLAKYFLSMQRDVVFGDGDDDDSMWPVNWEDAFERVYKPQFGRLFCVRDFQQELQKGLEVVDAPPQVIVFTNNHCVLDLFCVKYEKDISESQGHSPWASDQRSSIATTHRVFHCIMAGLLEQARLYFLDLSSLMDMLLSTSHAQLMSDMHTYLTCVDYDDLSCRLVCACLEESRPALLKEPQTLPMQLLMRMDCSSSERQSLSDVQRLLLQCRTFQFPGEELLWFRPSRASFKAPADPLIRSYSPLSNGTILCLSPLVDEKYMCSGGSRSHVQVLNLATGECEVSIPISDGHRCLGVDMRRNKLSKLEYFAVTCTTDDVCRVWELSKRNEQSSLVSVELIHELQGGHSGEISCCKFRPDEPSQVCTVSLDGTGVLWEQSEVKHRFTGHEQGILCMAFLPQARLATAGKDLSMRIWSLDTASCLHVVPHIHSGYISSLDVRRDGQVLISASWDGKIKVWTLSHMLNTQLVDPGIRDNAIENQVLVEKTVFVRKDVVWGAKFFGGYGDEEEAPVRVGQHRFRGDHLHNYVGCVQNSGRIAIFDLNSSKLLSEWDAGFGKPLYCLTTWKGDLLASGVDHTLNRFRITSMKDSLVLNLPSSSPHSAFQASVLMSCLVLMEPVSHPQALLGGEYGCIQLFDVLTGACLQTLQEPDRDRQQATIESLLVLASGRMVLATDQGGRSVWFQQSDNQLFKPTSRVAAECRYCPKCTTTSWIRRHSAYTVARIPQSRAPQFVLTSSVVNYLPVIFDRDEDVARTIWVCTPKNRSRQRRWSKNSPPGQFLVISESNGRVHFFCL